MEVTEYLTLNSIYQNKVLSDSEIVSKLERIGLTTEGNNYRIEKTIKIATNNFENLRFEENDEFDKKLKETILTQGQFSKIELNF